MFTLFCGKYIQDTVYTKFYQNQPKFVEDMTKFILAYFFSWTWYTFKLFWYRKINDNKTPTTTQSCWQLSPLSPV